jgi:cytochrome c556
MRRFVILAAVAWAIVVALALQGGTPGAAQTISEEDYDKAMKTVGDNFGSIRKKGEAGNIDVANEASRIAQVFASVEPFWTARKDNEAVKLLKSAIAEARTLEKAAKDKNGGAVATSQKALGGTCRACHEERREEDGAGGYRLKKS